MNTLIVGSIFIFLAVFQWLKDGSFQPRSGSLKPREESPVYFWFMVFINAIAGITIIFFGLQKHIQTLF